MPPRAFAARRSNGFRPKTREKKEPKILFQEFFKSVGPRTYVAQVKEAGNGNHFLVLTEGKRDDNSAEVRKTRLFVYSEDFPAFFRLVKASAEFVKGHPVDPKVKAKRDKFWAKQGTEPATATAPASEPVAVAMNGVES